MLAVKLSPEFAAVSGEPDASQPSDGSSTSKPSVITSGVKQDGVADHIHPIHVISVVLRPASAV